MRVTETRLARRCAAGLAAIVCAAGVSIVVSARPAFAAACSTTAPGVAVVVDFASLGGGLHIACAPGDPASGYNALHSAGFGTAGTSHDGPGFVCRINNAPPPSQESCTATPPITAYWSYWHAQPGGRWVYSQLGALAYNPAPGSVEGWAFGAGSAPAIAPPRPVVPPAAPTKKPPPPAPPASNHPATRPPGGASTSDPGRPADESPAATPTAGPDSSESAPPADSSSATPVAGRSSPLLAATGAVGTLAGVAVVIALAAGGTALAVVRRRRRSQPPPD